MPCTRCKESYQDSYNVSVDTLKRENPTLSEHDIRVHAAQKFRPVYHAMEVASTIENAGNEEYENGEFSLTPGGEMYFPNMRVTAEQLHINQLRSSEMKSNPAKYSLVDHQTSRLIQYAIVNGATVVRTSFSRDGLNNRDIVEYVYDRATNRGTIKVINTAQDGLYHSFDRIREIARRQSPHLTEVAPSEKVFILTNVAVLHDRAQSVVHALRHTDRYVFNRELSSERIRAESTMRTTDTRAVRNIRIEETHTQIERESIRQVTEIVAYVSHRIVKDTGETIIGVRQFFQSRDKRQDAKDRLLGLPVVREVRKILEKVDMREYQSENNAERLTITKIREKPVRIGDVIQKRHQEMRQTIRALAVVADTRVGIAAIPLLIGILAKELPTPVKALEKSIGRHERKVRRIKNRELRITEKRKEGKMLHSRKIFDRRSGELVATQLKEKKKRQKANKRRVRNVSEMKRRTEAGTIKPKKRKRMRLSELMRRKEHKLHTTKKKEQPEISRAGSVRRIDIVLQKTLVRLAKKIHTVEIQKKNKARKNEKNKTFQYINERVTKQKKEETVARFSFAWVMWILQENSSIHSRIDTPKNNILEQSAMILQKEPTPWILLSIIWYLTMIREKKVHSVRRTAYRKKKKSKFTSNNFTISGWHLPNQAIIFAYGS